MGFFDNIGKAISDTGNEAIAKSKKNAEINRCNAMITDEERRAQEIYERIGMLYVEKYGSDPEKEDVFKELIEQLEATKKRIQEYKLIVIGLRGNVVCPQCGQEVQSQSLFCPSCGNKMAVQVQQAAKPVEAGTYCTGCGAFVPEGNKFCSSCGTIVS